MYSNQNKHPIPNGFHFCFDKKQFDNVFTQC